MSSTNDVINSVIGVSLNDIQNINPFKTVYHIVYFIILLAFVGLFLALIGMAFLYSVCNCICIACSCNKQKNKIYASKESNRLQMLPVAEKKQEGER